MRAVALMAVLALSVPATALAARPGTLDRSFGGDGRVETRVPGGRPAVAGIESLPGGKLLLAGTVGDRKVVLIRYRRDGTLDRRFGHKGVRSFVFDREVVGLDTQLDAQGRLLLAGGLGAAYPPDHAALVLRFDRGGRVDSTFDGDGIALVDFGGKQGDTATGLALQPDGRILLSAVVENGQSQEPPGCCSYRELGVARLDATGRLDDGFGDGGLFRATAGTHTYLTAEALDAQPNGRIVVAANTTYVRGSTALALRLLADGTPDLGFGDNPTVMPGFRRIPGTEVLLRDLVVERPSGRIVLAGSELTGDASYQGLWFGQILENGLGPTGVVGVRPGGAVGTHVALDGSGRAIVVGNRGGLQVVMARFGPNGVASRCFGRRGLARIAFRSLPSNAAAVTVHRRNRVTVGGPAPVLVNEQVAPSFQLARLHTGPCPRR
jgi:uncharacterized delta-60 repeat protein